ncbi:hypothetical protein BJV82DRAFT_665266 [Fennellomyces sp. T-0311]|nr:hypothetical protein BJV82DRAFT_665266 [Fennellomyces sp. T-0311]
MVSEHQDGVELLPQSIKDTKHIFEQAAIELVKNIQFFKGYQLACALITLLPTSSTGCLLAAPLNQMHGKIKVAIGECGRGIEMCVSAADKDLLAEQMDSLQRRLDQMRYT